MTHTFDFNDDLALDTGEFMAFDDIENDIDDDDLNFLHDDDFMQFEEGDLFFKKLWRGVKKVARAAAPIAKQLAPTIGKIVGGAVGSFAGAPTIGATVGTHLGNFVQNLEDEGDGSFAGLEADTDTHDEMEAEDFIKPSEDDEGLAEYMASAAATAKTAVDSAAMAGGIATAATAKSPSKVRAIEARLYDLLGQENAANGQIFARLVQTTDAIIPAVHEVRSALMRAGVSREDQRATFGQVDQHASDVSQTLEWIERDTEKWRLAMRTTKFGMRDLNWVIKALNQQSVALRSFIGENSALTKSVTDNRFALGRRQLNELVALLDQAHEFATHLNNRPAQ